MWHAALWQLAKQTESSTEISRRILTADAQVQAEQSGGGQSVGISKLVASLLVISLVGGSLALYWVLGVPGYGDLSLSHRVEMAEQARKGRPSQQVAEDSLPPQPSLNSLEQSYLDLIEQPRQTVAKRPDDLQGPDVVGTIRGPGWRLPSGLSGSGTGAASQRQQRNGGRLFQSGRYVDSGGWRLCVPPRPRLRSTKPFDWMNATAQPVTIGGLMMSQTGRPDVTLSGLGSIVAPRSALMPHGSRRSGH